MSFKIRAFITAVSGVAGLAGLALLNPALAEESAPGGAVPQKLAQAAAPAAAADTIEEVIVTARRREENLQVVPISVTVLSGDSLAKKGIQDIRDLAHNVPSVVIETTNGGSKVKVLELGIRGVRSTSSNAFDDQPINVYVAEAVDPHPYGVADTFFDIDSIQVLKGPQGTLFGRNATGGAILIEPKRASIDEGFNGYVKGAVGDYNLERLEGMVNIPLNDVAALRIALKHEKRDGYMTNVLDGQHFAGLGNDALRIGLLLKPTKNITSHTFIDVLREDAAPYDTEVVAVYPPYGGFGLAGSTGVTGVVNGIPRFAGGFNYWNSLLQLQKGRSAWKVASLSGTNFVLPYDPTPGSPYRTIAQDQMSPLKCQVGSIYFVPNHYCRADMTPKDTMTVMGLTNNTVIDFDGFSIKNIFGIRRATEDDENSENFPGAWPLGLGTTQGAPSGGGQADQRTRQTTAQDEFQLFGKAFEDKLDWVAGAFYMKEWADEYSPSYTNTAAWTVSGGWTVNKGEGLYAQGTYAVTDKLKATLGVRRNVDNRNTVDNALTTSLPVPLTSAAPLLPAVTSCLVKIGPDINHLKPLPVGACELNGEATYTANTYTMALDYKLDENVLLYGTHRRGYHSGGFSIRSHYAPTYPYLPEYVLDNEVGVKADWSLFDRPIRTNFALYSMDYSQQQVQVTVAGSTPIQTFIANVGKSKIDGWELEVTYKPTDRLELSGWASYTNPRYIDYNTATRAGVGTPYNGAIISLANRPYGINKEAAGLSLAYTLPLDESVGKVTARADATVRSKDIVDNSVAGLASPSLLNPNGPPGVLNPDTAGFTETPQHGYGILNLRVDWQHPFRNPIDVSLFVTNVGNTVYYLGSTNVNGMASATVAPPRMFGVEVSYAFGEGFKPKE